MSIANDQERLIPVGGVNPYSHHPGFSATQCEHRMTVTARGIATSSGFACLWTGGHCIPGSVTPCQTTLRKDKTP